MRSVRETFVAVLKASMVSFFILHNPFMHLFPPLTIALIIGGPAIAGAMLYDRVKLPWWGNLLASLWIGVLNTAPYWVVVGLVWQNLGLFNDERQAAFVIAAATYACLAYTGFGWLVSLSGIYVRKATKASTDQVGVVHQPVLVEAAA